MAIFNKKNTEKKPDFFIRVLGDEWVEVAKVLHSKPYEKHEIRIEDDTAVVDGEKPIVKIYFNGTIDDYINVLVDLRDKNIVQIKEDEKVEKK